MPRIKHIKGQFQYPPKYYSLGQYKEMRDAVTAYAKALGRETECKHRWKEVNGKFVCAKCEIKPKDKK